MNTSALAARFYQGLSEEKRDQFAAMPELGQFLADRLTSCQLAWPELTMAPASFVDYLAARAPEVDDFSSWQVETLFFCQACLQQQPAALAVFMRQMVPIIAGALRKLKLGGTLKEDAQQDIVSWLLVGDGERPPLLANYNGYSKLERWLRVVTARNGRRLLGKAKKHVSPGDDYLAEQLVDDVTLSGVADKSRARLAFKKAFKQALAELDANDQALLRCRYVDGFKLEKLGTIWRVHHATILRRLDKLREKLVERTRTLLIDNLGLREDDCASLMHLLKSDMDLTLHTFLSDKPPEGDA